MTTKQKAFKKRLIQKIHLSKKYKDFYKENKDIYYGLIKDHFGVDSSTEMNIEQLVVFCDWLNDRVKELPKVMLNSASDAQVSLITKLWGEKARDKSDKALRAFIYRLTKNNYLRIQSISKKDASVIIVALKNMKVG